MIRKGIILAGGNGSRLYPITKATSKQLIPVYDKPMIYYPLSILMLSKITNILIISTPRDISSYKELLGNGSKYGLDIEFKVQDKPDGLAQAFILGEDFIDNDNVCLILGDNIYYGQGLPRFLSKAKEQCEKESGGACVFGYYVSDPERYGILEFDENNLQGNDFLAKLCLQWEEAASKKPLFTRLVIFRIGIVLDSSGGALGKMLPIFKIGLGGPIGDGNQWMSWIHRQDVCSLINAALINKKFKGVYNAVSPQPVRMKEFSNVLAKCLKKPNFLPVPGFLLNLLLGDSSKLVLEGQKVNTVKINKNIYKFKYPLLEDAIYSATKN